MMMYRRILKGIERMGKRTIFNAYGECRRILKGIESVDYDIPVEMRHKF